MSRALRLHERHSKAELAQMHRELLADPASRRDPAQRHIELLTPKARKLADDMRIQSFAIEWGMELTQPDPDHWRRWREDAEQEQRQLTAVA